MATNKTLMERINQGRQYRSVVNIEVRSAQEGEESYIVEGYATTFNEPYILYDCGDFCYQEQVDSKAFDGCDMSDVIFQYDHAGRVYARGTNHTLSLTVDEHGLFVRADLSKSEDGKKLYEEIKNGLTTKMSFGFTVEEDQVTETFNKSESKSYYMRTILKISKLYDVSAVSLPANDGTEISARNLVDGVIAKRMADEAQAQEEEERKRQEEAEKKEKELKERERLALELSFSL